MKCDWCRIRKGRESFIDKFGNRGIICQNCKDFILKNRLAKGQKVSK